MTYRITVTVRRGPGRDTMGDATTGATHTVEGCARWPRSSTETRDRSQQVSTGYMLSVPSGADILATDEVQFPGESDWWTVEGDTLPWGPNPFTGRQPGMTLALSRVRG